MLVGDMFLYGGLEFGAHLATFMWAVVHSISMSRFNMRFQLFFGVLFNSTLAHGFGPPGGSISSMPFPFTFSRIGSPPFGRSSSLFFWSIVSNLNKFVNRIHSSLAVFRCLWKDLLYMRISSTLSKFVTQNPCWTKEGNKFLNTILECGLEGFSGSIVIESIVHYYNGNVTNWSANVCIQWKVQFCLILLSVFSWWYFVAWNNYSNYQLKLQKIKDILSDNPVQLCESGTIYEYGLWHMVILYNQLLFWYNLYNSKNENSFQSGTISLTFWYIYKGLDLYFESCTMCKQSWTIIGVGFTESQYNYS